MADAALGGAPPVVREGAETSLLEEDDEPEPLLPSSFVRLEAEEEEDLLDQRSDGGESTASLFPDAGTPFLMPLRRESTPVYRGGEIVSFKTSYSGELNLGIGDEVQPFRVVFDTGSGHVVVPSISCYSDTCLRHRRYDIAKSSSALAINMNGTAVVTGKPRDQVTIGFGTGKVVGRFIRETVCLGAGVRAAEAKKAESGPCVEMNAITAIDMTPQPFASFKFDGIVGLGLGALALSNSFSFFSMISSHFAGESAGDVEDPSWNRFGVFLAEGTGASGEAPSEIAFGGYNPKRILEPLQWAPVAMKDLGYWQVEVHGIRIGNTTLNICKEQVCRGVVDTGTSHLGVPSSIFEEVAMGTTVPAGDIEDCLLAEAPEMEILMDGFSLRLRPQDYMRRLPLASDVNPGARVAGDDSAFDEPDKAVGADIANGGKTCRPKLMPVNMAPPLGPNLFLLGEPLLKRYYTAFEWKEPRVGFALAAKPDSMQADDGSYMYQTVLSTGETDHDIMWDGDDNSFMLQKDITVGEVEDNDADMMHRVEL